MPSLQVRSQTRRIGVDRRQTRRGWRRRCWCSASAFSSGCCRSRRSPLDRNADGIVVLTGGTSRVTDALELLAAGSGKRLLITGVNPGTTNGDIARQTVDYGRLLNCCVDLDYSALNTLGNAVQTRHWALEHDFNSLIIVTSAYHMPRALAEIAHQLPDVALIPFPVVSDRLRIEPWWSNSETTKLVLSEYLKYLFAKMRMRFDAFAETACTAGVAARPA